VPPSIEEPAHRTGERGHRHVVHIRRRSAAGEPQGAHGNTRQAKQHRRDPPVQPAVGNTPRRRLLLDRTLSVLVGLRQARLRRANARHAIQIHGGRKRPRARKQVGAGNHHRQDVRCQCRQDRRQSHTAELLHGRSRTGERIRPIRGGGGQRARLPELPGAERAHLGSAREEEQPQSGLHHHHRQPHRCEENL